MNWKALLSGVLCVALMESTWAVGAAAQVSVCPTGTAEDVSALIAAHWQEDYYSAVTVDLAAGDVTADGESTTLSDVLDLSEFEVADALESAESLTALCTEKGYGVQTDGDQVTITNPYQTCRLVVRTDVLTDHCGAEEVLWFEAAGEYILQFATEEETRQAYDTLSQRYDCYLDEIVQESSQLEGEYYGADCYTYGASMMGLDRLKLQTEWYDLPGTVTVAVIDSGIDETNKLFEGRTISSASCNLVAGNQDLYDASGHGTHVCGILADCTPDNVQLLMLKVFDDSGNASILSIETAIYYAVDCGADVINMSCGFEYENAGSFTFLDDAISAAYNAGVSICAAAGNQGLDVTACYPACNTLTISVGAIDADQTRWSLSSTGTGLDFVAPGVKILSAQREGDLVTKTGTSMAAPHLTAAVAMIRLIHPDYTVPMVYNTLKKYATDLGEPGKDELYGYGYVDLLNYYSDEAERGSLQDRQVLDWVNPFQDVEEDTWFYNSVRYASFHGLFNGVSTDSFAPNVAMTRGMVVTVLWRMAGEPQPQSDEMTFTDVKEGSYYETAICWAKENGIVSGFSDTQFAPDEMVSREQFAAILYRYATIWEGEETEETGSLDVFADGSQASDYSVQALQWAVAEGIVAGSSENGTLYLLPKDGATRAQAARMLMMFREL